MVDYQFDLSVTDSLQPVEPMVVGAPAILVPQHGAAGACQAYLADAGVVKPQAFNVACGVGVRKMQWLAVVALPAYYADIEAYGVIN